MRIETINGRKICIAGIGKMFYQEGFPITMSIHEMTKRGIEVSIYHVADECLKHGWSAKTTFNKLKADLSDDIYGCKVDVQQLEKFCFADYEHQREMIFEYLFGDRETALKFGKELTLKN